ncbi:MAG: glycosyltransferase family 2 protein [Muribaculaceae bacterium]|nr:glycosyltransferase family 2 protein [Muribaculaceae bacterium]
MDDITVIILTYNEEIHIGRCIESVKPIAKEIVVVDSESTDRTVEIAKNPGAEVYTHQWPGNQAAQFNWALDNVEISTEWILRLDADEYLTPELIEEIKQKLPNVPKGVNGIMLPLKNVWMGKPLKHGGATIKILRLFRNGYGRYEPRMMDEQLEISEGEISEFEHPFADDNLNDLNWWTTKHLGYSNREAAELLDVEYNLSGRAADGNLENLSKDARRRRELKLKYAKQPLFWRSFAYFVYRYVFKLGFLEGKVGFLRHFLQGWWYRTLVDAKIFEIKRACGNDPEKIRQYLKSHYNIDI